MTLFLRKIVPVVTVFAVIVLPQANRATQLEYSVTRARLVEGAYVVADAVERFAEENQGIYPVLVGGFILYLPHQSLIMNALTMVRTEPIDGAASGAGQIGCMPVIMQGLAVGFTITAFGRDSTVGVEGDGTLLYIVRYPGAPASQ